MISVKLNEQVTSTIGFKELEAEVYFTDFNPLYQRTLFLVTLLFETRETCSWINCQAYLLYISCYPHAIFMVSSCLDQFPLLFILHAKFARADQIACRLGSCSGGLFLPMILMSSVKPRLQDECRWYFRRNAGFCFHSSHIRRPKVAVFVFLYFMYVWFYQQRICDGLHEGERIFETRTWFQGRFVI